MAYQYGYWRVCRIPWITINIADLSAIRGERDFIMATMRKPITITYDYLYGSSRSQIKAYTAETYEDYHRVVRILHENEDIYKVISVIRG